MRVLITGSSGKIGREAAQAFKRAGHTVTGVDLRGGIVGGVRTLAADCADFGEVIGALSGVDTFKRPDAVVHLAGIPAPGLATDAEIFRVNTLSTYNVFSACQRLGINNIVWASSETILGLPFAEPPAFVPLDESAPDRPNWSYSLAKQMGEAMADQMTRWNPALKIASLRFSNVFDAADYAGRAAVDAAPATRRLNLWGYVDARDAGEACRLAVETDFTGHERMVIAAADTVVDVPTADLLAQHFPDVPRKHDLGRFESLLSSARAGELIGYAPRHGWREQGGN